MTTTTAVLLSDDEHEALTALCREQGITLSELVSRLLEKEKCEHRVTIPEVNRMDSMRTNAHKIKMSTTNTITIDNLLSVLTPAQMKSVIRKALVEEPSKALPLPWPQVRPNSRLEKAIAALLRTPAALPARMKDLVREMADSSSIPAKTAENYFFALLHEKLIEKDDASGAWRLTEKGHRLTGKGASK